MEREWDKKGVQRVMKRNGAKSASNRILIIFNFLLSHFGTCPGCLFLSSFCPLVSLLPSCFVPCMYVCVCCWFFHIMLPIRHWVWCDVDNSFHLWLLFLFCCPAHCWQQKVIGVARGCTGKQLSFLVSELWIAAWIMFAFIFVYGGSVKVKEWSTVC